MTKQRKARDWIGGAWRSGKPERDSINPATGEGICTSCDGDDVVAQAAIDAATKAFEAEGRRKGAFLHTTALSYLADAYSARLPGVIRVAGT